MKKLIIAALVLISSGAYAQNVSWINTHTNMPETFTSQHINSDFGRREEGTLFHDGLDVNGAVGARLNADLGYKINKTMIDMKKLVLIFISCED